MWPKEKNKKVSAAVRILQQKRDASARATHLMVKSDSLITYEKAFLGQAAVKKFFTATFLERKIMSTKTSFKRIALVTASALAIAGFSAVPANAVPVAADITSVNLKQSSTNTNVVGTAVSINVGAVIPSQAVTGGDNILFRAALISYPAGGSLNVSAARGLNGVAGITTPGSVPTYPTGLGGTSVIYVGGLLGLTATATTAGSTITATSTTAGFGSFFFTPTVAGTYVVSVWADGSADGMIDGNQSAAEAGQTISITVAAAPAYSNSLSQAYIVGGDGFAAALAADDLNAVSASKTAVTAHRASITINAFDTSNHAMLAPGTVTVSVSGAGALSSTATNTDDAPSVGGCSATTNARVVSFPADAVNNVIICSDGTAGVGTYTVTMTNAAGVTTTIATKTVTFFGSVAKIVATPIYTIGAAGGGTTGDASAARTTAATIPAVIVKLTDSAGNVVSVAANTISALSSDITVVNSAIGIAADTASSTYSSGGAGFYNASFSTPTSATSGKAATLTFRILDPADVLGLAYLTSVVNLTIGGSVATETLSFDKTSYAPGEVIVLTRTAKDSAGNPVADGTASPAVTFSKAIGGTAPGASIYVGGKKSTSATTPTLFAPVVAGDFMALATSGNTAGSTLTAMSTVSIPVDDTSSLALDAANAATDAANNAYDEAQNATQAASDALAAVTALSVQVGALIATVKSLAAVVAKIKAKVKA